MQKNLSNQELVAAGHKFAANISADTPLIDMAKMVSELATQLDVALAAAAEAGKQRDALAAENAVMLKLLTDISENHVEYFSEGEGYTFAGVPLDYVSEINMYVSRDVNAENPFPATDDYLNAVRAEGVELFATFQKKMAAQHDADNRTVWADERRISAEQATGFAAQLRAGNAGKDGV